MDTPGFHINRSSCKGKHAQCQRPAYGFEGLTEIDVVSVDVFSTPRQVSDDFPSPQW